MNLQAVCMSRDGERWQCNSHSRPWCGIRRIRFGRDIEDHRINLNSESVIRGWHQIPGIIDIAQGLMHCPQKPGTMHNLERDFEVLDLTVRLDDSIGPELLRDSGGARWIR